MTRVVVCGGRDYQDRERVFGELDALHAKSPIKMVVHGACVDRKTKQLRGADRWAQEWAIEREVAYAGFPAEWAKYGRSAGPKRNKRMADWASTREVTAFAFPGGDGTANMVATLKELGINPIEVAP